ncbi:hypothetical protein ACF0H5_005467 [Mactra antiquata]
MASEALLKGRYIAQFKKLGAISLVATGATGLALYFGYYRKRLARVEAYNKTLTPEYLELLDKRIMRFAGLSTKEEFENQDGPKRFISISSDEAKEGYEAIRAKMEKKIEYVNAEFNKLKTVDPEIKEAMKLKFSYDVLGGFPDFFETFKTSPKELNAACARIKRAQEKYGGK